MTIWDRISHRVRDAMERDGVPPVTARGAAMPPSLADKLGVTGLSDEALGAELERRRRARGKSVHRRPAAHEELDAQSDARRARMRDRPLAKAYASLEVSPSATRSEIERAYRGLLRQYHPDRHIGDEENHRSAVALVTSLTDAYLAVLRSRG